MIHLTLYSFYIFTIASAKQLQLHLPIIMNIIIVSMKTLTFYKKSKVFLNTMLGLSTILLNELQIFHEKEKVHKNKPL